MKHLMLSAAALILAFSLGACERETRTVEKGGTTVVQPKETVKEKETVVTPTPGPTGPAGPAGPKGEPGKPGDTTVNVTPAPSESKTEKKD